MKIGLIADSHIPEAMPELPSQVRTVFAGVDLIVHAGDLHCLEVLDWLEAPHLWWRVGVMATKAQVDAQSSRTIPGCTRPS